MTAGSGAAHLIAGLGFRMKTLAAQSLALSQAAGQRIWGALEARRRRVTHVISAARARLTTQRYQRLALAMGIDLAGLGDSLIVASMPPIRLDAAHAKAWRGLMTDRDLVVIDSLRAASAGRDENDSSIRSCLDMLGALSETTQCRALVIHHARKPSADEGNGGRHSIRG